MTKIIEPTNDEIRRLAFEIFELRQWQHGWDVADWHLAQSILRFHKNYERVNLFPFTSSEKIYVGTKTAQRCRFCEKSRPDVSFSTDAHAIPAFLGNNAVFTHEECDDCNQAFSQYLEDDFAKMLNGVRTTVRIKGRKRVPKYKTHLGDSRIEVGGNEIRILQHVNDPIASLDEQQSESTFSVKTQPFRPMAVFKFFSKLALTLLPSSELTSFRDTRDWVNERDLTIGAGNLKTAFLVRALTPGPFPERHGWTEIFRRRHDAIVAPYLVVVVRVMNLTFQAYVPFCERDSHLSGTLAFPRFPAGFDQGYEYGETQFKNMHMDGVDPIVGDVQINMHADSTKKVNES